MWALGTGLMLTLGVAYGFRLGAVAGTITFLVAEAVLAALLLAPPHPWSSSTTRSCAPDARASRSGTSGRVATFDAARTRDARGTKGDKRAYLCLRGWIPASVLVEVDDPDDPHPYWSVSTRRGRELAPVLAAARDAARDVAG